MIEIRQRYTRVVIRTVNAASLAGANLAEANFAKADLTETNLVGAKLPEANLSRADLAWADLSWANLSKANLYGANLHGAGFHGANLRKANLVEANLCNANLLGANLARADLAGADLTRAFLCRADFSGSNLAEADLTEIRADFFAVLSLARNEVAGLRLAVVEGRIDGSSYSGPCACLVGTIAILQGCEYRQVPSMPIVDTRPAERFFTGISAGDTPETNPVSAIVLGWIDEFAAPPTAQRAGANVVEIRQRYTRVVIRIVNAASLAGAALAGANLTRADLAGANLLGADLREAHLSKANLSGANLRAANLSWANLFKADLTAANLRRADLREANLLGADLRNANLTEANLRGAILASALLSRADFRGSNLAEANLTEIRDDFFAVLSLARNEVAGLRLAVVEGRIDGSSYSGPCACLVGTIAILQDCDFQQVPGIPIDAVRPAERFFTGISAGNTPETNPVSAIVLGWINEFTAHPIAQ